MIKLSVAESMLKDKENEVDLGLADRDEVDLGPALGDKADLGPAHSDEVDDDTSSTNTLSSRYRVSQFILAVFLKIFLNAHESRDRVHNHEYSFESYALYIYSKF